MTGTAAHARGPGQGRVPAHRGTRPVWRGSTKICPLPAPRALAAIVLSGLRALSVPAQDLVTVPTVLGRRCPLVTAAALAGQADPLAALDEAVAVGLASSAGATAPRPSALCTARTRG
ncbi:MAG TPA: hypothetical protein VGS06_41620 [Streptosporangiaceae bacterium]|nr:hypothetical protein [Streptosporangiaceae bacterium]